MNPEDSASLARPLLAAIGTRVTLELITEDGETEQLEFDLVPDRSADFARGFLAKAPPWHRLSWANRLGAHCCIRMRTSAGAHRGGKSQPGDA